MKRKINPIKFDIQVVTFNRPLLLKYTLKSLCNQTYKNFTVHLIDHGSLPAVDPDKLPKDLDIRFTRYKNNYIDQHGVDVAERVLEQLEGTHFINFADDDILLPNALDLIAREFEKNPAMKIFSGGYLTYDHGENTGSIDVELSEKFNGRVSCFDASKVARSHISSWGIGQLVNEPRPPMSHPSTCVVSNELLLETKKKQGKIYVKTCGDVGFLSVTFNTDYVYYFNWPLAIIGRSTHQWVNITTSNNRFKWKNELQYLKHSPVKSCSFQNIGMDSHLKVLHKLGMDKSMDCSLRPDFFVRHIDEILTDEPWTQKTDEDIQETLPHLAESLKKYYDFSDSEAKNGAIIWLKASMQRVKEKRKNGTTHIASQIESLEKFSNILDYADHIMNIFFENRGKNEEIRIDQIPISLLVGVYNEEDRIQYVLESGLQWADEIIIVNKSSTDRTKEICQKFGEKVKVVDVPFSPSGYGDNIANSKIPTNDWIFFATASEIPTMNLIKRIKQVLHDSKGSLDLVYVPRKYYSLGIRDPRSPWYLSYFPFLINRKKARISNTIHKNFRPSDPKNTAKIDFSDDCCVYHLTHTTARDYMLSMSGYFEVEAEGCENPTAKIKQCMANIAAYEKRLQNGGNDILGHYFAWQIYWMGTALFVWEKWRGIDVPRYYKDIREKLLQQEWSVNDEPKTLNGETHLLEDEGPVNNPLVSAIVWTYGAENLLQGCLEDIESQTIRDQIEVIVVDSGLLPSEAVIVKDFQLKYSNIKYIKADPQDTIYSVWNQGIQAAAGKYIATVEVGDRLLGYAYERMVHVLETHRDIALVYADAWKTKKENQTFENFTPCGSYCRPDFNPATLLKECYIGSQPMWRKSVHANYGYFDENLMTVGDWEFWLRLAQSQKFLHLTEFLGLCLERPLEADHPLQNLFEEETGRLFQHYSNLKMKTQGGMRNADGTPSAANAGVF